MPILLKSFRYTYPKQAEDLATIIKDKVLKSYFHFFQFPSRCTHNSGMLIVVIRVIEILNHTYSHSINFKNKLNVVRISNLERDSIYLNNRFCFFCV